MSSSMEGRILSIDAVSPAFAFLHPFLKKCIFELSIFNMSILKCVFLYSKSGKFCRFGAESFADPDRQILPVWAGISAYPRFLTVKCRR